MKRKSGKKENKDRASGRSLGCISSGFVCDSVWFLCSDDISYMSFSLSIDVHPACRDHRLMSRADPRCMVRFMAGTRANGRVFGHTYYVNFQPRRRIAPVPHDTFEVVFAQGRQITMISVSLKSALLSCSISHLACRSSRFARFQ